MRFITADFGLPPEIADIQFIAIIIYFISQELSLNCNHTSISVQGISISRKKL